MIDFRTKGNEILARRNALPEGPARDAAQAEFDANQKAWSAAQRSYAREHRIERDASQVYDTMEEREQAFRMTLKELPCAPCPRCAPEIEEAVTHNLKIWPEYFGPVRDGRKTFEVRSTEDRDFSVGDRLLLREWDPKAGHYTGYQCIKQVTYVMSLAKWGAPNPVVMGLIEARP